MFRGECSQARCAGVCVRVQVWVSACRCVCAGVCVKVCECSQAWCAFVESSSESRELQHAHDICRLLQLSPVASTFTEGEVHRQDSMQVHQDSAQE